MRMLLYVLLMILWTPLFVVGLVFYFLPILIRRGKASGTAYEPFNARLLYHLTNGRPDPAALRLSGGLPATNPMVMWLMVRPLAWATRATGFFPAMAEYPPRRPTPMSGMVGARCDFLDRLMLERCSPGTQIVILGAGWDTRAYGLLAGRELSVYEVDAPATQAIKLAAINKSRLDAQSVTFVACDFNRQSWLEALEDHGFDSEKRTFILWEGVTMYLNADAIERTLEAVATLPAGSAIAFDFFSREWFASKAGKAALRAVRATYAEPFTFGFSVMPDFEAQLSEFVEAQGLSLAESRPMGDEGSGEVPYGGLALAVVASE